MNSRPKQPKYARNKNVLVIGGSGSGKTRFFVKPNLMQCSAGGSKNGENAIPVSYIVTDPKGTVLVECGKLLQRSGYRIKVLNTINFKKSMHYNPFAYIRNEKDILKLVNTIIANTKGDGEKSGEDFWVKSERLFYCALIGYIWYEAPEDEKNFTTLLEMINASEAREDDPEFQSPVDLMFERLEEKDPEHFAVRQYKKFLLSAGKTRSSILISCGARLAPFDIRELRELLETDEMELDTLGDRKTALFVIISDTDDTFNFIVSILYTQLFNLLCDKADDEYSGRLPVHVRCLLDEFANIGQIPKFEKLIATIRSREISACIILQSQSQLKAIYKDNADTIVGNCDTTLFLGGKEKTTLKEMSELLGKETIDSFNTSETRGREQSHGLNYQKLGKELPDIAVDELTGDVDRFKDFFAALEQASPVPVGFEKIEGGAHGYYHLEEKRIAIDEGMSDLQTLKTAIHEIAHAKLHDIDLNAPKEEQKPRVDRRTREVEAESVAYTVCQHYGLDTSDYSFGYVAGWSGGKELAELRGSLETIRNTAAEMINAIDGHFAELQKAQEKEKAQPQHEGSTPEQPEAAAQEKAAFAPETIYRVRRNPYSDREENAYLLQAYVTQENGRAKMGEVLFRGTPEKCRELLGQLNAGELTAGQVKELYAKPQEQPEMETVSPEKQAETPEAAPQKETQATVTYYPINEAAARHAKEMNSFSDYKPGSATAAYRQQVDEAAELAERQKARVDPMYHEKIDSLLDTYARKLAANINKGYEIDARVPSILIAGGSNFPTGKKEKQNAARDRNMEEYQEIEGLLDKIRSTGMGGISADDPQAVQKLEKKLAGLEKTQETMKAVNAYYRKHKTLDGCPHISPEHGQKLIASMASYDRAPYPTWALSNNNAEIRRVKERIKSLTQQKEIGFTGWEFDGGRVEANTQDNRLQIFFDEKPDAAVREELKSNGFRWSPKAEAWQRQLNSNAYFAANYVKSIQPLTGEKPTDLQRAHIRAQQSAAQTKDAPREKAAMPEYIYKIEANPRSDSRENLSFLQAYLPHGDGTAAIGDVLYIGTPEKCRELLGQLNAGELTQGEVKELYAKAQEQPETGQDDTFSIYQLKDGDETRDYRFEPYDRLQAAGLTVDRANYELVYTAPLVPGTSLDDIFTRFNIDHPKDFKGHSLSVSDVVVLHQDGQDTAHYVDRGDFKQVPEFLQEKQPQLTPDELETGEKIRTPRGTFYVTGMSREQMEAVGYGVHHQSDDGKYLIMGNGTRAFAVATEQENPLKAAEQTTEQNYNMIDGWINNTPTVDELEAKVKAGETISLVDLANAVKADKECGKAAKTEKKPSIRAQLKADKERAAQKKPAKQKSQDLERS